MAELGPFDEREIALLTKKFQSLLSPGQSCLTSEDMQRVLAQKGDADNVNLEIANLSMKEADRDGDGAVDCEEFLRHMAQLKAGKKPGLLASLCLPSMEEEQLEVLLQNNRKWVTEQKQDDPDFFEKLRHGQQPKYLFIGCADSRVDAQQLMGMRPGEMFVHRNVANLVVNTDLNLLSVLAYAVEVLQIPDIIVCGHYECGGVRAAVTPKDHGLVEHWIRNIRDVARLHEKELASIADPLAHHQRLVELNVQEQCLNLAVNPIVQRQQQKNGFPRIHGFVYDVGEGLLRRLSVDIHSHVKAMHHIYDVSGSQPRTPWESRLLRCEAEFKQPSWLPPPPDSPRSPRTPSAAVGDGPR